MIPSPPPRQTLRYDEVKRCVPDVQRSQPAAAEERTVADAGQATSPGPQRPKTKETPAGSRLCSYTQSCPVCVVCEVGNQAGRVDYVLAAITTPKLLPVPPRHVQSRSAVDVFVGDHEAPVGENHGDLQKLVAPRRHLLT